MSDTLNIAHFLPEVAAAFPHRRAVVAPAGRDAQGRAAYVHLTFSQLDRACDAYAWGLGAVGVTRGTRALLMVRPGLDFIALTFALFKLGAVPILIDPGMGWRGFLRSVAEARPTAFLGIPLAHLLRLLVPSRFRSVRIPVTLGRRLFWGGYELAGIARDQGPFPVAPTRPDEVAAILFTSGSTGPAKGVVYTHGIFDAQVQLIRRQYNITSADVDLPCFPLFALFSVAMGMTAVVPDMDPTRPARVDPRRIVEAIHDHGVTFSFGSPALWRVVARHCRDHGLRLPTLRAVLMAGAPVPGDLHECLLHHVLPAGADTHTPYGATEALPVTSLAGTEALAGAWDLSRQGAGMCVGRPYPGVTVRVIRITEGVLETWDESLVLPPGQIGEIVVKGPTVTPSYDARPRETALAKIRDADGRLWHRMGDVGYLDADGRLWFCGRQSHRVVTVDGTLFTVPCEAIFNRHPRVFRSALVGVGATPSAQVPVMVVEPATGARPRGRREVTRLCDELLALGGTSPLTRGIRHVLIHPGFPVDIRHNAKIRREELARWAALRLHGRL